MPSTTVSRVFHVIYGDCSGKALPKLLRSRFPGARIVSSIHQPVVRLKNDAAGCAALRASDAVVAVAEAQVVEFRELGLSAPLYSIPHGVWTEVFRPRSVFSNQQRTNVLLVGSFLRDWEGAKQVMTALARLVCDPLLWGRARGGI